MRYNMAKVKSMKAIGNLFWWIFGGLETAVLWLVLGLLWCLSIVGIKCGLHCIRIGWESLSPLGKIIDTDFDQHPVLNILWLILGGWLLSLLYFLFGLILCLTGIGMPYGMLSAKFSTIARFPFGGTITK